MIKVKPPQVPERQVMTNHTHPKAGQAMMSRKKRATIRKPTSTKAAKARLVPACINQTTGRRR